MFRKIKGQSTAEYAIVIAIVIGALIAMQVYIKRGLQGRYHDATRYMATNADGAVIGTTEQYEPYYLRNQVSAVTTSRSSSGGSTFAGRGGRQNTALSTNVGRDAGSSDVYTGIVAD
ncbi:MAG: hypothetical protein Q8L26_03600 [Candidatus Omnitrophota bacterium]|nr:hypothetical protein [Candidatus Omnitrophota bacterium]